jgi:hypothetical protein
MHTMNLAALTTEVYEDASGLETWMLEYCDETGREDYCDRATAAAFEKVAKEILEVVYKLIAIYADGHLVDIKTVRVAESIAKSILAWIFPA